MTNDKYEKFLEPLFLPGIGVICMLLAFLVGKESFAVFSFYWMVITSGIAFVYLTLISFKLIPDLVLVKKYGTTYSVFRWILGILGLIGMIFSLCWIIFRIMVNFGWYNENGLFGKPDGKG